MCFDKTGTLTTGKMAVQDIVSYSPKWSQDQLLFYAASAERGSQHPLGKAILEIAKKREIILEEPEEFLAVPGSGIKATINEKLVHVGNLRFLKTENFFCIQNRYKDNILNQGIYNWRAICPG